MYRVAAKAYAITVNSHQGLSRKYSLVVDERSVSASDVLHRQTARTCHGHQLSMTSGSGVVLDCDVQILRSQGAPDQQATLVKRPEATTLIAVEADEEPHQNRSSNERRARLSCRWCQGSLCFVRYCAGWGRREPRGRSGHTPGVGDVCRRMGGRLLPVGFWSRVRLGGGRVCRRSGLYHWGPGDRLWWKTWYRSCGTLNELRQHGKAACRAKSAFNIISASAARTLDHRKPPRGPAASAAENSRWSIPPFPIPAKGLETDGPVTNGRTEGGSETFPGGIPWTVPAADCRSQWARGTGPRHSRGHPTAHP